MRDFITAANTKVEIRRKSQVTRSSGDQTMQYIAVAYDVPAKFKQLSAAEAVRYGRDAETRPAIAWLPPHIDVQGGDLLIFGTRRFEVRGVTRGLDRHGIETHLEISCEATL